LDWLRRSQREPRLEYRERRSTTSARTVASL
jgi:hypothetical protein